MRGKKLIKGNLAVVESGPVKKGCTDSAAMIAQNKERFYTGLGG